MEVGSGSNCVSVAFVAIESVVDRSTTEGSSVLSENSVVRDPSGDSLADSLLELLLFDVRIVDRDCDLYVTLVALNCIKSAIGPRAQFISPYRRYQQCIQIKRELEVSAVCRCAISGLF